MPEQSNGQRRRAHNSLGRVTFAVTACITGALVSMLYTQSVYMQSVCAMGAALLAFLLPLEERVADFDDMDSRIRAILFATSLAVLTTIAIYSFSGADLKDPGKFLGAVYAGWTGSVIFFSLLGVVVAVVSLERPEDAPFDYRARILFRRATGEHIDFIVRRIGEYFEQYSELTICTLKIVDFHAESKKYRVEMEMHLTLRNYINDRSTSNRSCVGYEEITPPPPGAAPNRLSYIRVDGVPHNTGQEAENNEIKVPFDVQINKDMPAIVETAMETWMSVGEQGSNTPTRFSQTIHWYVENQLAAPLKVPVELRGADGAILRTEILPKATRRCLLRVSSVPPGIIAYRYTLGQPSA